MKKFIYLLSVLFALCFTGCKDKNSLSDSIVGNWYSSYYILSYIDTDRGGDYVTEKDYYSIDLYIHEDHSFSWNAEKGRSYGTWLKNGNQLKLSFEGGGTLYEDFRVYSIDKLTSKEMILREDMGNGYVDYYFSKR